MQLSDYTSAIALARAGRPMRCMTVICCVVWPLADMPNELVIREGQEATALFFINRGQLHVIKGYGTESETLLAELSGGQFFGEASMIKRQNTNATVRSVTYSDLMVLMSTDFQGILSHFPDFQEECMKLAAKKGRWEIKKQLEKATAMLKREEYENNRKSSSSSGLSAPPRAGSPACNIGMAAKKGGARTTVACDDHDDLDV